jgi:hypothetical protein
VSRWQARVEVLVAVAVIQPGAPNMTKLSHRPLVLMGLSTMTDLIKDEDGQDIQRRITVCVCRHQTTSLMTTTQDVLPRAIIAQVIYRRISICLLSRTRTLCTRTEHRRPGGVHPVRQQEVHLQAL